LHRNCLLKHVAEGEIQGRTDVMEEEEENLRSYWKRQTGISKQCMAALCNC